MARDAEPLNHPNPWPGIAWWVTVGTLAISVVLGFVVLGAAQQNAPSLGAWAAFCHALGITPDTGRAGEPQPPLVTPTRIAWTGATLATIAAGDAARGASVAPSCTPCHGEAGVSHTGIYPTLAGMEAAVIYKQLDDYRAGKRQSPVMQLVVPALSASASADVAAYFASQRNGLAPIRGESLDSGHSLRESNPAVRLVFAGDPARGIPPCSACHGPAGSAIGAPSLQRQQPAYIESELAAFAQGSRHNDINEQMRTIAAQLTPDEMRAVAELYGAGAASP